MGNHWFPLACLCFPPLGFGLSFTSGVEAVAAAQMGTIEAVAALLRGYTPLTDGRSIM